MEKNKATTKKHNVRNSLQMGNEIAVNLAKARIKADREKQQKLAGVYRKCERVIEDAIEEAQASSATATTA